MLHDRRLPLLPGALAVRRYPARARPARGPAWVVGARLRPVSARGARRPARVIRAGIGPAWVRRLLLPAARVAGRPARVIGTLERARPILGCRPATVVGARLRPVSVGGARGPARMIRAWMRPVRPFVVTGPASHFVPGPGSCCPGMCRPSPVRAVAVLRHWCAPALLDCAQRHPDCHQRWPSLRPPVHCDHGASSRGRSAPGQSWPRAGRALRGNSPARHTRASWPVGDRDEYPSGDRKPLRDPSATHTPQASQLPSVPGYPTLNPPSAASVVPSDQARRRFPSGGLLSGGQEHEGKRHAPGTTGQARAGQR